MKEKNLLVTVNLYYIVIDSIFIYIYVYVCIKTSKIYIEQTHQQSYLLFVFYLQSEIVSTRGFTHRAC